MRILIFFLFLAGLVSAHSAKAQSEITTSKKDTSSKPVVKDSARLAIERMPKQAAIRSAIVPGLGQIHNKRWWKVPFIYAGFVGVGLAYEFNQRYYKEFLGEVQYRQANNNQPKNPKYAGYSFEGMVQVKDSYRRNRDLSILGFFAVHAVNIIDAYVDAKFFRYDISSDLSIKLDPSLQRSPLYTSEVYILKIKLAL